MFGRLASLLVVLLLVAGCSSSESASPNQEDTQASPAASATPTPTPTPTPTLPGGGRELFPDYRLCGYVGYPGAEGQGRLGIGDLEERMTELQGACAPYAGDRAVMPVMELIAVTVQPEPGPDGLWRERIDPSVIDQWLATAREHGALLLLDIQPGQANFMDELKALEPYLSEPDVGVALDPEWAMGPGEIPMQSFGSISGAELDEIAGYLSGLVEDNNLPEKVMLYHILHPTIISGEEALTDHPGIVQIKSVDGIGSPEAKISTYQQVAATVPPHVYMGFKLFYDEDVQTSGVLMTPDEVLALSPVPDYVLYE
ncbi:hypothetical protein [Propionimicrobium sp. PCR01-08-3]|uniref:hypothetical protein n=1 Tax=Propionimicrobium sp. PCR01-08-3 TaxID=3052086 RepID=UPI00255C4BB7|nr:hypothetical protein [Propionimicrobium sp. PCR01-08-3]WIY82397.1 hypothetical protein QQ658_12970 [Propionimicrobium sp. PCR01-08-3]